MNIQNYFWQFIWKLQHQHYWPWNGKWIQTTSGVDLIIVCISSVVHCSLMCCFQWCFIKLLAIVLLMFVRSHERIVWQSLVGNYNVITKTAGYTALIIPTKTWSGRNTTGCSNSKCGKSRRSSCGCRTLGTFILHVSSRLAMIVMIMILLVGWYQSAWPLTKQNVV